MNELRIGLAQVRQTDDLKTNGETILRFMDEAGQKGVRIVCFPEAQTVGYRVDIAEPDTPVPVDQLEALHAEVTARISPLRMRRCRLQRWRSCTGRWRRAVRNGKWPAFWGRRRRRQGGSRSTRR